jgi:hypothetical protein
VYRGIGFIAKGEPPKAGEHWELRLRPELAAARDKLAWFPKVDYQGRFKKAHRTAKWAVTMAQVREVPSRGV